MAHPIERPYRPVDLVAEKLRAFSLAALADQVRQEDSYTTGGKSGLTLLRQTALTVVLTVLRKGTEIHEHKAPAPATVVVLEGALDFRAQDGEPLRLVAGESVVFAAELPHRVSAVEDSAFLIVIGGHAG